MNDQDRSPVDEWESLLRGRAIALSEILSVGIAQQSSQPDAIHRLWAVPTLRIGFAASQA
jgi:hypothetical protein